MNRLRCLHLITALIVECKDDLLSEMNELFIREYAIYVKKIASLYIQVVRLFPSIVISAGGVTVGIRWYMGWTLINLSLF